MLFCKRYPLVAWSRELTPAALSAAAAANQKTAGRKDTVLFTRLRCKMWDCDYCAAKNQAIWRAFLYSKMPEISDNWWFMTLTAHSRMREQQASYKNLQHGIDVMMKRMRRVFGEIDYVRVFEKHPTSEALHAHLCISNLTPFVVGGAHKNLAYGYLAITARGKGDGSWSLKTFVKKTAQECRIGYMADCQSLNDNYAVHYATKYLTKAAQEIEIKGIRHVQTTRNIGAPSSESNRIWKVGSYVTARDFKAGETLLDMQTGETIPPEYWSEFDVYPPENS